MERDIKAQPHLEKAKREADKLTVYYSAPPIPVLEIAENNGVNVVFATFGPYSDKVAGYCDFESRKLFVNTEDSPRRQSFTIAHELGHWIMHRDVFSGNPDKYPVLLRFSGLSSDPREKEADKFAAHLLVPDRLLKPVSSPFVSSTALANIFFVSRTMMEIRLQGR